MALEELMSDYLALEYYYKPADGYSENSAAIEKRKAAIIIMEDIYLRHLENASTLQSLALEMFDSYASRDSSQLINSTKHIVLAFLQLASDQIGLAFDPTHFLEPNANDDSTNVVNTHQEWVASISSKLAQIAQDQEPKLRELKQAIAMCFIELFSKLVNLSPLDQRCIFDFATQQVYRLIIRDGQFTKFKPSTLAASAVLVACLLNHSDAYASSRERILVACRTPTWDDQHECMKEILISITAATADLFFPAQVTIKPEADAIAEKLGSLIEERCMSFYNEDKLESSKGKTSGPRPHD